MSSADIGLPEADKQQLLTWAVMVRSCKSDILNQKISFNGWIQWLDSMRVDNAATMHARHRALKDDDTVQC